MGKASEIIPMGIRFQISMTKYIGCSRSDRDARAWADWPIRDCDQFEHRERCICWSTELINLYVKGQESKAPSNINCIVLFILGMNATTALSDYFNVQGDLVLLVG